MMQKKTLNDNQHGRQLINFEKPSCIALLIVGLIGGASLVALFSRAPYSSSALFCRGGAWQSRPLSKSPVTQLDAILHYATTSIMPQQSIDEISVTFNVLKSVGPCNFLVFGLGHDSMMWDALNPGGKTLFLEETPDWITTTLKSAPALHADAVAYRTKLSEADDFLKHYRNEPSCRPNNSDLRGNSKCRLALNMLTEKVYNTEWDLIMIDAPRGYFPEAPGRMAAIYSAAIMARNRKKPGVTHVFLHDVDRQVESTYAETFLCKKYLVKAVERLWHFEIPAATKADNSDYFC
ncbi:hypothetical protein CASFOL_021013 [Castilleja foliolosa]|uniref:Polysaccharide biosynthesis domain-containing protein n=1 Tax=Castilleja foliolosa TaxID=1961234 RepID=A0ABD3D4K7_9LAMI